MKVEISKEAAPDTPASVDNGEFCITHVSALMTMGGIESIVAKRYACGFGSRLHVSIAPFASAPESIKAQGVIIKDALAQIMSVANISRIVVSVPEEEMKGLQEMWDESDRQAKLANSGSGQDFSGNSSAGAQP